MEHFCRLFHPKLLTHLRITPTVSLQNIAMKIIYTRVSNFLNFFNFYFEQLAFQQEVVLTQNSKENHLQHQQNQVPGVMNDALLQNRKIQPNGSYTN